MGKVHSRLREDHREPEVPKARVRVVERRDGLARITSKELAITHPVKDGILLNACSTKTRMVAVLGRSAHSHTVRLTHSRRNGPNRIMTKALWPCRKREIGKNENLSPTDITINQGNLMRVVAKNWDEIHRNVFDKINGFFFFEMRKQDSQEKKSNNGKSQGRDRHAKATQRQSLPWATRLEERFIQGPRARATTSPTRTTNLAFLRRKVQAHSFFPPACGTPLRLKGDTRMVSTASCAPWKIGRPSATTSNR